MKKLLILLLLPFAFATYAQTDNDLEGAWIFKDVYSLNGEVSKDAEKGKSLLQTLNITFLADNKYTSQVAGINEKGSWKIIDKSILFTTENGSTYSWPIIKFDNNELIVQRKTTSIILRRKS